MAWSAGGERDILRRIVVLLLSLADLAESAARAPYLTRCRMLWALQEADTVMRDYIASTACGPAGRQWAPALVPIRYGNAPADAMTLALALRTLALAVEMIVTLMCRSWAADEGGSHVGHRPPTGDNPVLEFLLAVCVPVQIVDTS